ncbi:MAG: hypothetical protein GX174_13715 [Lentisphaerae bacterium]|nr:hypothetical protein [Lentisphaerota bacterium]
MKQKPTITTVEQLRELKPCAKALEWLAENGITELADAWDRCHRGDWMLWLCDALSLLSDREMRMIACKVVRETPIGDGRKVWDLLTVESRHAVSVAEKYADGDATDEQLADASAAVASATKRAASRCASAAAGAAAAAAAAVAAAWAADAAADAAWAQVSAAQADLVRAIAGNPFREG